MMLLEIQLAIFSCVYDIGIDSYYPLSIMLSIAKFVSIKSSISNMWTVTENLYWNLNFVYRTASIFFFLLNKKAFHISDSCKSSKKPCEVG